jgi:hypothetical protein
MKILFQATLFMLWLPPFGHSQGIFNFYNPTAQTRLDSTNGPLAGPGIWGQPLVGVSVDSLSPLGLPLEHDAFGIVGPSALSVPGVFAGQSVLVQLAAWDGTAWGTSLTNVPVNQIGYTDIVLVPLGTPDVPWAVPQFTRPAVVPLIPEPSAFCLAGVGAAGVFLFRRKRFRTR